MRRSVLVTAAGVVAAGAALLLSWTSARRVPVRCFTPRVVAARPRNVVLVTIDTLRADHLSLYGYPRPTSPHVDAFARAAMTYENAYATATFTSPSIVSMLTGLYPPAHGVRFLRQTLPPRLWTLPGHLRGLGWHTAAVVSNWVLKAGASGLARDFEVYDDEMAEPEPHRPEVLERTAQRTTDAAMRWLARRPRDGPFLLWVHYIDPHGPYVPPPPFDRQFVGPASQPVRREKIPWYQRLGKRNDLGHYVDQYDGEIAYVDEQIGRLLLALDAQGLLADTLVVFASDHGESLTERHGEPPRYFHHGHQVWEELARVPLVVYRPGGRAGRSGDLVSLVDLVPTLLRALEVPLPPLPLDGRALGEPHTDPLFVEASNKHLRGVRWGRFKLVARVPTAGAKDVDAATRFDLVADPRERRGSALAGAADDAMLASLRRYLARDTQDLDALRTEVQSAVLRAAPDAKDASRLRALGYVD